MVLTWCNLIYVIWVCANFFAPYLVRCWCHCEDIAILMIWWINWLLHWKCGGRVPSSWMHCSTGICGLQNMMMILCRSWINTVKIYPTLQSPGIFNALLHFTYTEMRHKFGPSVTLTKMKKRVQRFRTKFMAFQGYINLPGVTFLRSLHTVRIDGDIYFQQFKDGRPVRFFSVINGSKCIHACNISSTYHFPL